MILNEANLTIPKWGGALYYRGQRVNDVIVPAYTYYIYAGGRESGKSYFIADYLINRSLAESNINIICARHIQKAIKYSVHSLIKKRIIERKLEKFFNVTEKEITSCTDSKFIFTGLWLNTEGVKSIPDAKYLWIEEASNIHESAWDDVIPTLTRNDDCVIICTLNPRYEDDYIYKEFLRKGVVYEGAYVKRVNYYDNPYGIGKATLNLIHKLKRDKPEKYRHIYLGECRTASDAQIFKDCYSVTRFEDPPNVFPLYGLDFGFSVDALAGIRCYIHDDVLYISHEAVATGVSINNIKNFLADRLPGVLHNKICADSANPGNIDYLKNQAHLDIFGAKKGAGSVEAGIDHMKSYSNIVVHERCVNMIRECAKYQYVVDSRTEIISRKVLDKENHCMDATRYALEETLLSRVMDWSRYKGSSLQDIHNAYADDRINRELGYY